MRPSFRDSMTWLHTWAGLLLGSLLFAIFWMGTLSVFDREIDRWMMPETRLTLPAEPISLDAVARVAADIVPADTPRWQFTLPTEREPVVRMYYQDVDTFPRLHLDPATLKPFEETGTLGGTGFIFPFHFSLHLRWLRLGYWLVGLAGMAMLVLLVSGVIIHRNLFADFFTFRPQSRLPRSSLDLHNLTGVLALPFHFVITLSGLIIFFTIFFPTVIERTYGSAENNSFNEEAFGTLARPVSGEPAATMVSLDGLARRARDAWQGSEPFYVRIWNQGDANATIELRRTRSDDVQLNVDVMTFDAASGEVVSQHSAGPVVAAQRWIAGFHFIQFDHWALRWVYFVLGLSGCVLIGSGFVVWFEARRRRHLRQGLRGVRFVEGLAIGSVTGLIVATLAFFVANRLLPADATLVGYIRAQLEVWAFLIVWGGTFLHAGVRSTRHGAAWVDQCLAICTLSVVAVALNGVTTGDHLIQTVSEGQWAVAGMDLLLLLNAGVALGVARRLAVAPARWPSSTAVADVASLELDAQA